MNIKICGIRTIEAAQAAQQAGAGFIGLNFIPSSRRYIALDKAQEIINSIRIDIDEFDPVNDDQVAVVGIFKDDPVETVNFITDTLQLDYVQLHGNETPEMVSQIEVPVIKAFSLPASFDSEEVAEKLRPYQPYVYAFLLDREMQGEGERLNLQNIKELQNEFRIFLAGGLNPENVANSILIAEPFGVDVAGGIETKGEIDIDKVRAFIANANVDSIET